MIAIPSSLAPLAGQRRDPETVKRDGWRKTGILVIWDQDARLTPFERSLIRDIGNRLYGASEGMAAGVGAAPAAGRATDEIWGKRSNACALVP